MACALRRARRVYAAARACERCWARRFFESFFGFFSASSSSLVTARSFSHSTSSMWHGLDMYGLVRPWARYVRLRCFCARFTWMWLISRFSVSRPLTSALLSAFLSRCSRNLQLFTGHRTWVAPAPGAFLACAWRPMQPLK